MGKRPRAFPASAISQLPLAQNNPHVKVAYFWVTYPDPLQMNNLCTKQSIVNCIFKNSIKKVKIGLFM